ncbi:hypothetical protein ACFQV4_30605 [Streptomyces thermocarboxydus]
MAREVVLRPGQVTQADTTPLRILARGDDGRPTATELTTLIDVANHSACALMITPSRPRDAESGQAGQATRAIDLTLMLAQALAPWPVMPGWDPLSAAAASSLPFGSLRAADERFTEATAARPVIRPELIIYDQGSPYVSEHFIEVCDRLRIARRPAREDPDRQAAPRALLRHPRAPLQSARHARLAGPQPQETRPRHRPDAAVHDAELQQMAQEWVALEYQQTPTRGCATRSGQASFCRPTRCTRSRWPAAATGRCRSPRPEPLLPAAAVGHPRQGWLHDRLSDLSAHRAGRRALPGDPPAWRLEAARPGEAVGMPLQPLPSRAGVVVRPHGRHLGDLRFPAPAPAARSVDRGHVAGARRAAPGGGGSKQDEEAIALSLAQRDRRRRSRRPPPKRTGAEPPFQGLELETEQPSQDPYAGLEEFDLSTLRPYPALPISPMAPLCTATSSLPVGSDDGADFDSGLRIRSQRSSPTTATAAGRRPSRPKHRHLQTGSSTQSSSTTPIRTMTRPRTNDIWDA